MVVKRHIYSACAEDDNNKQDDDIIIPETPVLDNSEFKRARVLQPITPIGSTTTTTSTTLRTVTILRPLASQECTIDHIRVSLFSMKLHAHLKRLLGDYQQDKYIDIVMNWVTQYTLDELEIFDTFLQSVEQHVDTNPATALVRHQALLTMITQPYRNIHGMIDAVYVFTNFEAVFNRNLDRQVRFEMTSQEL